MRAIVAYWSPERAELMADAADWRALATAIRTPAPGTRRAANWRELDGLAADVERQVPAGAAGLMRVSVAPEVVPVVQGWQLASQREPTGMD